MNMTITEVRIEHNAIRSLPEADTEVDEFTGSVGESQDWTEAAACRAVPGASELFFSEEVPEIVAAKRICAECPVIAPCLEAAIARREPCGVWGGQLFDNGKIINRKRRRGRPPKVARPEDQLPEVPIPAHLQKLIA
jgi:WhiB family redox-sensing transcriptional regulator